MAGIELGRLIHASLKRPWIVMGLVGLLMTIGWFAYQNLPMEAYPDFTDPMVRVITMMPGKSAEEIERLVTIPLEREMNGIPGQAYLRSQSLFGLSVVKVGFQDGTLSMMARQRVLERLATVDLPEGVSPQLDPDASPISEIYRYTLSSAYYDPMSLKAIEEWQLERTFKQIPGVVDITSFGGPTKTYQVSVSLTKLQAFGLDIKQVFDAISASNASTGGNYIENNGQAFIVRGIGLLKGVQDLEAVVISTTPSGTPIRVKDIGSVEIAPKVRLGQVGKNDLDDVVQGIVLMRRGEEPGRVIQGLYAALPGIQATLPTGISLVPLYDRMDLVRRTVETISHNVLEGIALVVFVLVIFLFDVRSALVASASIPFALFVSFILLKAFNIPANLLSLGAIDFGIIVDGTVLMVEAIHRALVHHASHKGKLAPRAIISVAAREVGQSILFTTLIIAVAFLSIFAFDGVAGKLFRPLAFTMIFVLLGSAICTILVTPVLSLFVLHKNPKHIESPVIKLVNWLYKPTLRWSLRHPLMILGLVTGLVTSTVLLLPMLGAEFLPNLDEGNIWLRVNNLPTSTSLEHGVDVARDIRLRLMKYPEVKNVVSQIGSPDDGTDANPPSNIEFLVDLFPAKQWRPRWHEDKEALIIAMDKDLDEIPGILTTFSQYIQDNVDEAIAGAKGQLAVKIYGSDLTVLQGLGDHIASKLKTINGLVDVGADQQLGQPQYHIESNRIQAARYGINVDDINHIIEIAVGGKTATQMMEGERRFDVVVRLASSYRNSEQSLKKIWIPAPGGSFIPLSEVATVRISSGATTIQHSENSRVMNVKANVRGRDLGSAVQAAQTLVAKEITLPPGYRMVWGGQYENQQRANSRLGIAIPITLALMYLLLYLNFRKHRDTLMSLSVIPVTVMGGIISLLLTHTYFSVPAGVGFIAAIGVSIQGAVMIIAAIRRIHQREHNCMLAVVRASMTQMQPVLMASVVAILGLIPAAVSNGIGSQSQKPFALVIIGGLLASAIIGPVLLPVLYAVIEHRNNILRRLSRKYHEPIQTIRALVPKL